MNDKPYSNWQKIDLHIHTDKSKLTKNGDYTGNFSVDLLHQKLIENAIEIFSLTDHNIINLSAYEEYYTKYSTKENPILFVGVELDIEVTRNTGEIKNYHTLLIFNHFSIEGVRNINTILENKYQEKGLALMDRKLTMEEVANIFFGEDFFFIPHAGSSQSIVDAYGRDTIQGAQKMVILMQSALEKVTKEETKNIYNIGFDREKPTDHRGQKDIAYINFSDNHNINMYPCIHKGGKGDHNFDYIKGSKSYETIRLAFIDPESRIISSEKYQSLKINGTNIEKFRIYNSDFIDEIDFEFSPYLNVIIGGRSSGKSLLLWILGRSIDSVKEGTVYDIKNTETIIKTINDIEYKNTTSINKKDLIFIKQGEIVKYFEEKKLKDLAVKVGKYQEYDAAYERFRNHNTELHEVQNKLVLAYDKTYEENKDKKFILYAKTLEDMQCEEVILKLDVEGLKGRIDNSDQLEEIKEVIVNLKDNINQFISSRLIDLGEDDSKIVESFNNLVDEKEKQIEKLNNLLNVKIKFINQAKKIVDSAVATLNEKASNKAIANFKHAGLLLDVKSKFKNYKQLKQNCDIIESFNYALNQEIILHEDIKLVLEVDKSNSIKDEVLECLLSNYKGLSIYKNLLYLLRDKTQIKNHKNNLPDSFKKKLEVQLKPIKDLMLSPNDFLKYSDTNTSKNKSPGYNSEKYLEIILQQSDTKSIFIDQPEDNLGNKFISKDLVKIIRSVKHEKQIFLVTHNPSIVVYGDAETVILAQNDNNKINYKQIKLEDKSAQKEICDILDGGEYIFNKRSQKYNIKQTLNS